MSAPTDRPRIGLTTYREPARWGDWNRVADLLPAQYSAGVQDAGGVALLLPPAPPAHAAAALDGVHGLLIAGGADVNPERYGAERHPRTQGSRDDRDAWELALVDEAVARDLPVLAICRGMQILNVARGGTLVQHLPDVVPDDIHGSEAGYHGRHAVRLAPDGVLGRRYGPRAEVSTYHHQAVDALGTDLVPQAWADDGLIEAVVLPDCAWVVGVQWHPEVHDRDALFTDFVEACRARASRTGG